MIGKLQIILRKSKEKKIISIWPRMQKKTQQSLCRIKATLLSPPIKNTVTQRNLWELWELCILKYYEFMIPWCELYRNRDVCDKEFPKVYHFLIQPLPSALRILPETFEKCGSSNLLLDYLSLLLKYPIMEKCVENSQFRNSLSYSQPWFYHNLRSGK